MYRLALVLVLGCIGCDAKQPLPTSGRGEPAAAPIQSAQPPTAGNLATTEAQAAGTNYYTTEELGHLGLRVASAGEGETLVCGSEADSQCLCLMPLDCEAGGCMGFSENVAAFRAALSHPAPGSKVQCDKAAIGDCGTFKYFDFQGDLYRREVRWFDGSGALVGQRDVTDYPAYCGKQTRARFIGRIPKCANAASRELLCGEPPTAMSPLDDLRRYSGPRARPTSSPRQ